MNQDFYNTVGNEYYKKHGEMESSKEKLVKEEILKKVEQKIDLEAERDEIVNSIGFGD